MYDNICKEKLIWGGDHTPEENEEYDIVTNNIFTIGWCTEKSKESSPQRCMFKIDNITKNSKSSILTSPKLESIFELPQYYDLIMSGVSSIDSSNNILYFVVSKKHSWVIINSISYSLID